VSIICFYLPPSVVQLNDTLTCNAMLSTFSYLSDTFLPICAVGDLNLPIMNWSANTCPRHDIHELFLAFFNVNCLSQLVDFPTRRENILDVILFNESSLVRKIIPEAPPLGESDHISVACSINFRVQIRIFLQIL